MNPTFFGPTESPLFGCFHPAGRNTRDTAVLLCPPVGQEYVRTHWVLRKLASSLQRNGFDVLRFDYRGVGDSSQSSSFGTPQRWIEDIHTAAKELRQLSASSTLHIVGLRLGALLALQACASGLSVRDLVLWDPVITGSELISEMRNLNERVVKDPLRWAPEPHIKLHRWWTLRKAAKNNGAEELLGFPWSQDCLRQLGALDATLQKNLRSVHSLAAFTSSASSRYDCLTHLSASSGSLKLVPVNDASGWDDHNEFEEALLADHVPQAIQNHLMRSRK